MKPAAFCLLLPKLLTGQLDLTKNPEKPALMLTALCTVVLAVFYAFPALDIAIARGFFQASLCTTGTTATLCGSFPAASNTALVIIRQCMFYLPHIAALCLLVQIGRSMIRAKQFHVSIASFWPTLRPYVLSLVALIVGPLLLVNAILKDHWDRPRPVQTDIFGGPFAFMPAGSSLGECVRNCSFISGEAAGAGWLLCLLPLLPPSLRSKLAPPLLVICWLTPLMRVSFGGHYASDAILGFFSSPLIFSLVFIVANRLERRKFAA